MGKTKHSKKTGNSKQNKRRAGKRAGSKILRVFLGTLAAVLFAGVGLMFALTSGKSLWNRMTEQLRSGQQDKIRENDTFSSKTGWEEISEADLGSSDKDQAEKKRDDNAASDKERQRNVFFGDSYFDAPYFDSFDEDAKRRDDKGRVLEVCLDAADPENGVSLLFAGDFLMDDGYAVMGKLSQRENGIYDCFSEETLELMKSADVFMLNNEFTYTNRGEPTEGKTFTFRSRPENVVNLDRIGVDIVSLANNHAFDYGRVSLEDTMQTLNEDSMPFVGAGMNLEDAMQGINFYVGGQKITILSATQIERLDNPDTKGATDVSSGVFRCLKSDNLVRAIEEASRDSDFVVVYVHWGTESTDEPDWAQPVLAKEMAQAGADLIIGDHPHVLQPIVSANGVPCIYSLGNYWFNSSTVDTCLVEATVKNGELESFRFIPAKQSDCFTCILDGAEKERVLSYMRSISPGVSIDDDGNVTF